MAKRKRRAFGQVKPRGKVFEVSYLTPAGYGDKFGELNERQYDHFSSIEEADAWLYQEKRLIELGAWSPVAMRKAGAKRKREKAITFADYAANWVNARRKPDGTPLGDDVIKRYRAMLRRHLNPFFGGTPMGDVSVRQVKEWLNTTADTMKDALTARHNSFGLLKAIFHTAATEPIDDEGNTLIERSPVTGTVPRPPKQHKTVAVTDAQIWQLHDVIRDRFGRQDLAIVPLIGLFAGCRLGEVLALRRCDVLTASDELSITESVKDENTLDPSKPRHIVRGSTKSRDSVRVIPISTELREPLYKYMESVPEDPETPLFRAPRSGGFLAENSFTEVYVKARELVPGLSGCRFHDLRHNLLTKVSAAAGVAVAKRIAGHGDVRVTGGYLDAVTGDDLRKAIGSTAASSAAKPASAAAGSGDVVSLAQTLAALDPEVRAQVLKNLPPEMQAQVMTAMFQSKE